MLYTDSIWNIFDVNLCLNFSMWVVIKKCLAHNAKELDVTIFQRLLYLNQCIDLTKLNVHYCMTLSSFDQKNF